MKKPKSSGKGMMWAIAVFAVLALSGVGFLIYNGQQVQQQVVKTVSDDAVTKSAIPQFTAEFNMIALASGAQDAEADIDIDIFEWNAADNDELANTKRYLDCSGVTPAIFNGADTFIDVKAENLCKVNVYKFWQSFTAADTESKIDDVLTLTASDLDDVDGGGTNSVVLKTEKIYLVTVVEGADADEEDVIPHAFLIKSLGTTTFEREKIVDGTIKARFNDKYFSDAVAHSKTRLSGSCEDDEDNSYQLDSSLNGFIDSSLTTATTVSVDCSISVEVTNDGYMIKLLNPLANSNSERAYLQVDPYGENSTGSWVEYGTSGLTGDVGFSSSANNSIIWEGMSFGGAVITDSSTSDAVKLGTEKIYEGTQSFFKDVVEGSPMVIPVHVSEVKVDYDLAVAGGDQIVSAASGSSPEAIADVNLVGLEATTDIIGQTLNG